MMPVRVLPVCEVVQVAIGELAECRAASLSYPRRIELHLD